ncbi:hypothetical protein LEA_07035, partial [human gut metagenome]
GVDLTTEWGKPLVEGEYGIKKTIKDLFRLYKVRFR